MAKANKAGNVQMPDQKSTTRSRSSTSLLVRVIVGASIVILGGVSIYLLKRSHEKEIQDNKSRVAIAKLETKSLVKKIGIFSWRFHKQPASLQELVESGVEIGLPPDPWGHPYIYSKDEKHYEVYSYGPDGKPAGGDDIGSAHAW